MWCAAGAASSAQIGLRESPEDNVGLAIKQTDEIIFPPSMTFNGITEGEARVVVSVDADGKLADCLVTGYTERAFADAAVAALKRWKYEPARAHGRATASRVEVLFDFKAEKAVVQLTTVSERLHKHLISILQERYSYQAYTLRELDHIPTPIHVVPPAVPNGGPGPGQTHVVTVEFYIDEDGKVRMPAVERQEIDNVYAAAAVVAVEQWRFEPPLRRGRPVLVLAKQDFNFVGK
jgi:TonB family protein